MLIFEKASECYHYDSEMKKIHNESCFYTYFYIRLNVSIDFFLIFSFIQLKTVKIILKIVPAGCFDINTMILLNSWGKLVRTLEMKLDKEIFLFGFTGGGRNEC